MGFACTILSRMAVLRTILLRASKSEWLRARIPRFQFSRRAVARFMPGEDVSDALKAAQGFQPHGIGVVTYLVELLLLHSFQKDRHELFGDLL